MLLLISVFKNSSAEVEICNGRCRSRMVGLRENVNKNTGCLWSGRLLCGDDCMETQQVRCYAHPTQGMLWRRLA